MKNWVKQHKRIASICILIISIISLIISYVITSCIAILYMGSLHDYVSTEQMYAHKDCILAMILMFIVIGIINSLFTVLAIKFVHDHNNEINKL